jgi:hypothetical protein
MPNPRHSGNPGVPLVTMQRITQDHAGKNIELGSHGHDAIHYSIETSVYATR